MKKISQNECHNVAAAEGGTFSQVVNTFNTCMNTMSQVAPPPTTPAVENMNTSICVVAAVVCAVDSTSCSPSGDGGGGGCFLSGTQVRMADGSSKAIEDIREGDLILETLTQKPSKVIGVKSILHNTSHWVFALDEETKPFMTECHPWYDESNQLCAMSELAEKLAPWLGKIKIVEVQNKIKINQPTQV